MTYVWKSDWIWAYESIWGIIEKFKYANSLCNSDISKLVRAKTPRSTFYIYSSMYASNNTIERTLLAELVRNDIFSTTANQLKELMGPLYNTCDIRKYMNEKWRYCPECIKIGYHSMYHQLSFLDRCIFHDIELKTECPSCQKKSSYVMEYRGIDQAFRCTCGYDYLLGTNPLEIFKNWNKPIPATNHNEKSSLSIPDSTTYMYSSLPWFIDKHIFFERDCNTTNASLSKILLNQPPEGIVLFCFRPTLNYKSVPSYSDSIYDHSKFIMMDEFIRIFKAIAKNIRRKSPSIKSLKYFTCNSSYFLFKYLQDRYSCSGSRFKDIDAELYAYIMWRKEVEGHEEFNTIHVKQTSRSSEDPQFVLKTNITGTYIYKYISNEIETYITAYKQQEYVCFEDYGIIVGALERIIGVLLSKYYNSWLDYALKMKESSPNDIIDFKAIIPFPMDEYLIKYNKVTHMCELILLD